ncbi:sigma-70 family RNA polymerase sigma factor [bacterium]|nr:sigma-70 family RNA polymerase sigma factor [bacterium]
MDFEKQLKPIYEDLVRFSWSLSGSKSDGDDLLQESLLKAWKAYAKLREPDRFKSWMMIIISNTHRSIYRKTWWKRLVGLDAVAEIASPQKLDYSEKEIIHWALKKLSPVQREAVVLFEVMGMTVNEIADHQKVTQSAVKSRLARGRQNLREHYEALSNSGAEYGTRITQVS